MAGLLSKVRGLLGVGVTWGTLWGVIGAGVGFVLGPLIEGNFRKMLGQYGDVWPLFTQPIALTFVLLSVASVIYSLSRRRRLGGVSVQMSAD